ncbi:putative bifunctional diguanylate cyclase/phosphodiesterase [Maritalea myrionectae]|uniref:putative bifunctional diguanylate cyclase/phosphodiesterase n=1 Tax=Maritalea myrionectae TaxID=454601 RepID=UPI0013C30ECB|nr:EAL domain-containing protein [Maritalea myrionectae]
MIERLHASQRQIPLMYGILILNMLALCHRVIGQAPLLISLVLPGVLMAIGAFRAIAWIRFKTNKISAIEARRAIKRTVLITGILAIFLVVWAFSLFGYVDIHSQYHIIFFINFTIIACIVCLVSIPQASIILLCFAALPTMFFLFLLENHVFNAIALNMTLVVGTLIFVVHNRDRYFRRGVESRGRLKSANVTMNKLANRDALTNVPNRRNFFNQLSSLVKGPPSQPPARAFFLILFDLDDFKPLNDIYGHGFGDKVLKVVAKRLGEAVPKNSKFARLGGDEFGIIFFDRNPRAAQIFARQVVDEIKKPILIDHILTKVDATVGVSSFPKDSTTGDELFEQADFALCYAKQFSRGKIVMFEQNHAEHILSAARLTKFLTDADLANELSVRFQPIWNCAEMKLIGFETLARWESPILGSVPPNEFIPAAESSGFITTITSIIFEKALMAATNWPKDLKIGLNISAVDISNDDTVKVVEKLCEKYGIEKRRVTIEITETAAMQDFERSNHCLSEFKKAGMSIAMDDFGTGNSSLSYIQNLPLDHVKLDRSFVQSAEGETKGRQIASTVIELCKALELGCIAEGIESEAQLKAIQLLGCKAFQGYYFSVPMQPDQTLSYIEKHLKMR